MKRVLVTGSKGMLGSKLLKLLGDSGSGIDLPETDITSKAAIDIAVKRFKPQVIVNTAALTNVDYCELNPDHAERVHRAGVENLCETGVRVITLSTDQVFTDGRGKILTESALPDPANVYANSKHLGESAALASPGNCVVRTSWLFGERGLVPWLAGKLNRDEQVSAVADQTACITHVDHLAQFLKTLAFEDNCSGLYHCVNLGPVTPYFLAHILRERLGRGKVLPVRWKDLNVKAARPLWSALGTERNVNLPSLEEAVEICLKTML